MDCGRVKSILKQEFISVSLLVWHLCRHLFLRVTRVKLVCVLLGEKSPWKMEALWPPLAGRGGEDETLFVHSLLSPHWD